MKERKPDTPLAKRGAIEDWLRSLGLKDPFIRKLFENKTIKPEYLGKNKDGYAYYVVEQVETDVLGRRPAPSANQPRPAHTS